jgi:hypothetical protein
MEPKTDVEIILAKYIEDALDHGGDMWDFEDDLNKSGLFDIPNKDYYTYRDVLDVAEWAAKGLRG